MNNSDPTLITESESRIYLSYKRICLFDDSTSLGCVWGIENLSTENQRE